MPAAIIQIVSWIFSLYGMLIIIGAVLSWTSQPQGSDLKRYIDMLTEPVLRPCRELMHSIMRFAGMDPRRVPIDLSPVIALFFLSIVRTAVMIVLQRL